MEKKKKEGWDFLHSFLIMRKPLTPGICVGDARFLQHTYVTIPQWSLLASKLSQKYISFHHDLFSIFVVSHYYIPATRDRVNTNSSLSQSFIAFLGR